MVFLPLYNLIALKKYVYLQMTTIKLQVIDLGFSGTHSSCNILLLCSILKMTKFIKGTEYRVHRLLEVYRYQAPSQYLHSITIFTQPIVIK